MIYLDNNATTRPSEGVCRGVDAALREAWANPSSVHRSGQSARQKIELARQAVADLIGARAKEITFVSGGTEANDLAIRGTLSRLPAPRRSLATLRVEHAATRDIAEELEKSGGASVTWLPIGGDGLVDPATLASTPEPGPALVSIQWANNETGGIQPVQAIAAWARARGAVVHVDGTQWVGKMPARVADAWCDLLTFSPHKFHGPKGVGVLWARSGAALRPRILGTQELGRRGGTENVPGILGAGVAATEAGAWLEHADRREKLAALRDEFERRIVEAIPDAVINGPHRNRLWNTTNIGFPRLEAEAILLMLSERGVCASAGAACSSGSLDPSPVLLAMGVPEAIAHGSVRFSLSRETTREEMEEAAATVIACVRELARTLPR